MKSLFHYLLQVIVASGILYGYYHLALRNKKFHRYNRFYLLAATVISITIPFLNIPVYFSQSETDSSFVLQTLTVISSGGGEVPKATIAPETNINWFSWGNLSFLFYILIALLVLIRIIFSLVKIRRIIKTNPVEQLDKIQFVNTSEPGTPFSFFRWLFWNKKIELQSEKGEQIFRHELFHIKQKHSWDIMYLELLTVLFWINPFFHLIKKEVKAIHEFLADQFTVKENQHWEYAELLLMQVLNTKQQLVNPFFHNQIKRRIAMITTSKKPSHQYLRKLMVLPVAAIVIGLFAFSYKERQSNNIDLPEIITERISDTTRPLSVDNKVYDKVDIVASFPGGNSKWRLYLEKNLDASVTAKEKAPDGVYTAIIQFIVDKQGNISDAKALTKHGYGMEKEALRVIKDGPKWVPALQNGEKVNAYHKQPITFIIGKGEKNFPSSIKTTGNVLNEVVVTTVPVQKTDDNIFQQVETRPTFPGGDTAWRHYLEKNANSRVPVDSGAPAGMYTVLVQFIVDKDGTISDVKAITKHGFGMENEVIRIIKNGPKWIPATQNGKIVKAYTKQPVTFQVEKEADKLPAKPKLQKAGNNTPQIPEISLGKLKRATPLQLLHLPEGIEIVGYKFTIDLPNDDIVAVANTGKKFNSATKNLLLTTTAGRYITFDRITIMENGKEKKIPSKVYVVTN